MIKTQKKPLPAIFLDRDGVINQDSGYVYKNEDLVILPEVGNSLKKLKEHGYLLIVITNQSGIARGFFTLEDTQSFHQNLNHKLKSQFQVTIDDFYTCPHHPKGKIKEYAITCGCRKPKADLATEAIKKWNIDLSASYFVGDKDSDIKLGNLLGIPAIQVLGQYPASNSSDHQCQNLKEATEYILSKC